MRLIHKSFVAVAAGLFSVAAAAQTTPPSSSKPQNVPDEPGKPTQSTPATPGETPPAESPGSTQVSATVDVNVGSAVYDQKGDLVGKILSVSGQNAVVDTGKVRAQLPISDFSKSEQGLVISTTKAQLEAEAKKTPPPK